MVVGAVVKVVVQVKAKVEVEVEVKVEAQVEGEAGVVVSSSSVVAPELTFCHLVIFCTDIIDMFSTRPCLQNRNHSHCQNSRTYIVFGYGDSQKAICYCIRL